MAPTPQNFKSQQPCRPWQRPDFAQRCVGREALTEARQHTQAPGCSGHKSHFPHPSFKRLKGEFKSSK